VRRYASAGKKSGTEPFNPGLFDTMKNLLPHQLTDRPLPTATKSTSVARSSSETADTQTISGVTDVCQL